MVKIDLILSIIIGLVIFVSDLAFSWLTILCGRIPVIFVIAVIIGIVAGSHGDAVIATMITWIGGILIGMLLAPIIFVDILNPDQDFLVLFIFVLLFSVRGFYNFETLDTLLELIVIGFLQLIVALIITPILYLISFAFAPVGVLIGKLIRKGFSGKSTEQQPIPEQPHIIASRPVEDDDPFDDNEEQADDSAF